jgi:hypothetical protein
MRSLLFKIVFIQVLVAGTCSSLASQIPVIPANTSSSSIPAWDLSTELYFYYLPDEDSYLLPILCADRDRLHLEARYNYEDFRSLSFFAGRTFGVGEELQLEVIPMLGGVFGKTLGVIPALEMDLAYRKLELYSEAEYAFDLRDSQGNFFYNWAELSYSPWEWLQLGITSQQTKEKADDWLIEHGLLLGFSYGDYSVVSYLFNPGGDDLFYIFSLGVDF